MTVTTTKFDKRMLYFYTAITGLLVFLINITIIHKYSTPIPWYDQWGELPLLVSFSKHNYHGVFKLLFVPSNEHHIFFTRTLTLIVYILRGFWDIALELKLVAILPALIASLLYFWSSSDIKKNSIINLIFMVTFFSIPLSSNIIWSFQSEHYFAVLFSIVCLRVASHKTRNEILQFILIIFLIICAFFSTALGIILLLTLVLYYVFKSLLVYKQNNNFSIFLKLNKTNIFKLAILVFILIIFYLTTPNCNSSLHIHSFSVLFSKNLRLLLFVYSFYTIWYILIRFYIIIAKEIKYRSLQIIYSHF